MTKLRLHLREHGAHSGLVTHITRQEHGMSPHALGQGRHLLRRLGTGGVIDGHVIARFGQGQHGAAANARGTTGDQGFFSIVHGEITQGGS